MPKKKVEQNNSKVKGTLEGVVVSNKMQKKPRVIWEV